MMQQTAIPVKQGAYVTLPVLGLGTWGVGGYSRAGDWRDKPARTDEEEIRSLVSAVEAGFRHIDTAELYAAGHSETLVGVATRGLPRDSLFITSKVQSDHLAYDNVLRACEGSLTRLGTEYLDCYLIHGPNPAIPLEETFRALTRLVDQKLIRHIGVSNFDAPLMREAEAVAQHPIVTNQIHFSLEARAYEENGTLAYCRERGIITTAYRPLSKGSLANSAEPLLVAMAAQYTKTPAQVALAWVTGEPNVVALVKMAAQKHIEENLAAVGWELTAADRERLRQEYPVGKTLFRS